MVPLISLTLRLMDASVSLKKHRQKLIVLVDQMGQHAGSAGKLLTKDGFNVRRLKGGMSEWQHQSMPVVQGQKN